MPAAVSSSCRQARASTYNLAVPEPGHGPLARQLAGHWPSFAAYGVSFLTIGIIWVNHHTLFKNLAKIDRTVLFLNLLPLFLIVAIPFTTATIAGYLSRGGAQATGAAVVYQGVFECMSASFGGLFWCSARSVVKVDSADWPDL